MEKKKKWVRVAYVAFFPIPEARQALYLFVIGLSRHSILPSTAEEPPNMHETTGPLETSYL